MSYLGHVHKINRLILIEDVWYPCWEDVHISIIFCGWRGRVGPIKIKQGTQFWLWVCWWIIMSSPKDLGILYFKILGAAESISSMKVGLLWLQVPRSIKTEHERVSLVGFSPGTKVPTFTLNILQEMVLGAPFTLIHWAFSPWQCSSECCWASVLVVVSL